MTISCRDTLKSQMEMTHDIVRRMIDDITEEESMRTIGSSPNHIKWQTGHLVFATVMAARALGRTLVPPEGWDKIFGRGVESPDKQTYFPPLDDLRSTLYDFQKQALAQLEHASDDHLTTKREISPTWQSTPLDALHLLSSHGWYHCGQIAMIRHDLGRERSFG